MALARTGNMVSNPRHVMPACWAVLNFSLAVACLAMGSVIIKDNTAENDQSLLATGALRAIETILTLGVYGMQACYAATSIMPRRPAPNIFVYINVFMEFIVLVAAVAMRALTLTGPGLTLEIISTTAAGVFIVCAIIACCYGSAPSSLDNGMTTPLNSAGSINVRQPLPQQNATSGMGPWWGDIEIGQDTAISKTSSQTSAP